MKAHRRRSTALVLTATIAVGAVSACTGPDTADGGRGSLVSVAPIAGYTASEVRARLGSGGFASTSVGFGVDTYRVRYRTPGVDGRLTSASGLAAVPRNGDTALTVVAYEHGTTSVRSDVPSRSSDIWASGPAMSYAAAGFATVAPDYLGLGDGAGRHPWMDVATETSASSDLLRASRALLSAQRRSVNRGVFVTGFSQGASAALGLARALDAGDDPDFTLRALAPVSGAYQMRSVEIPAMLTGLVDQRVAVVYAAYLLSSWNAVHGGIYTDPTEIFRQPYAPRVDAYFSGDTPGEVMVGGLPATLDELLTPTAIELLRRPSGSFARALDAADAVCTGWRPSAPVQMFSMDGDEQATTTNTDRCVEQFAHEGTDVEHTILPDAVYQGSRHLGSNIAAIDLIVKWFKSVAR